MGVKMKEDNTRHAKRVREGMTVKIIAGNDKGMTGTVLRRTNDRVVVQGVNVRKKHVRRSEANPQGGIINIECPLHVSNVMPCAEGEEAVKLKVRSDSEGQRELYYKQGDQEVAFRSVRNSK